MEKSRNIHKALKTNEFFRTELLNPTGLQISVLLYVILHEGVSITELEKQFNSTRASISRTIKKLSLSLDQKPKAERFRLEGFDLIETRVGAAIDPRAKACYLTKAGREFREKLKLV